MKLKADIECLIHISRETPKFVTVYRATLPWELWSTRSSVEYGKLTLIPTLSFGSEDDKKFSEENLFLVNSYTEAENKARSFAMELGLIR
jgi:hypothetical protein